MDPARPGPLCSVVIPTYNGRALLERCLASIARHRPADPGLSIEVIVADDASTDGTAEWLALRPSRGPGGAARAERRLLRGRQCGHRRGSGPFHPVAQQRHRSDRRLDRGGPGPVRRSDRRARSRRWSWSGRDPGRVDSAGDSYALAGWPTKRGHGQPGSALCRSAGRRGLRRQRIERVLSVGGAASQSGASIRSSDRITRISTWPSACAGPVIAAVFAPRCVIHHDVSATYDHGSPALQRRMARNAEIVFWANMPPGLLALALVPHLAFHGAARGLAAGPRPTAAVLAGQMRCALRLAGNQGPP